ncbi:MAG: GyrI-like domain-containing protein [Flavobacteriaceae bacterium]|nr:GyrI-like domain-containing protein [Flavobacteriaceae bacterium]
MKKILFLLLLLVVALAVLPLFMPKTMHIEEEYVFDAPVERVFNHFNDLKRFTQFDSWSRKDPDIKLNFSSPSSGEGASYMWESENRKIGQGSMSITDSRENEFIDYSLKIADMQGHTTEAIFQRIDDGKTRVIWSFDSSEAKYPFQVFNFLMKGTVRNNLKSSLVNLDSILTQDRVFKHPNTDIKVGGFNVVTEPEKRIFGIMQQTTTDDQEMSTAMNEAFGYVYSYLHDNQGLTEDEIGHPVVLWKQFSPESKLALFYCGFMLNKNAKEKDDFEYIQIPAGKYLTTMHNGSYNTLNITYERIYKFAEVNGIEVSFNTYDVYLNDATKTEEKDLKTQIFVPVYN